MPCNHDLRAGVKLAEDVIEQGDLLARVDGTSEGLGK